MNIKELLSKDETETVEFKKSLGEWKEIIETVSGFANTRGGIILVGVDKKGIVQGVPVGKGTIEDITNKIITNTEPKVYPEIGLESFNRRKIIAIKVEGYPYDVVLAFGRPFKRVGKNTVKMSNDEYKRKILENENKESIF